MAKSKKDDSDNFTITSTMKASSADEVVDKLKGAQQQGNGEPSDHELVGFVEAAKDARNFVQLKRQAPRRWKGEMVQGNLERVECPTTRAELEQHLQTEYGGGKYWAGVIDEKENTVSGTTIMIQGEPKFNQDVDLEYLQDPSIRRRIYSPAESEDRDDDPEEVANRIQRQRTRDLQQRIATKKLEQEITRLEELEGKKSPKDDETALALERTREELRESKFEAALDSVRKESDEKFEKVMMKLESSSRSESEDSMRRELDRMREDQKTSMEQMRRDHERDMKERDEQAKRREEDLRRQLEEQKNSQFMTMFMKSMSEQTRWAGEQVAKTAESNEKSAAEQVKMMLAMCNQQVEMIREQNRESAELAKASPQSNITEELRNVLDICREFMPELSSGEKSEGWADKIVGLVGKVLPEVVKAGQMRQSQQITETQRRDLIRAMTRGELERQQAESRALAQQAVAAQQAPARETQAPQPAAESQTPQELPKGVPLGPTKPEQQPQESSAFLQLKKQYTERVDAVLNGLLEEIEAKPEIGGCLWVEMAYEQLPEEVLDRIIMAKTEDEVYEAVKDWGSEEIFDRLYGFIKDDVTTRQWILNGVNRIKEMAMQEQRQVRPQE